MTPDKGKTRNINNMSLFNSRLASIFETMYHEQNADIWDKKDEYLLNVTWNKKE